MCFCAATLEPLYIRPHKIPQPKVGPKINEIKWHWNITWMYLRLRPADSNETMNGRTKANRKKAWREFVAEAIRTKHFRQILHLNGTNGLTIHWLEERSGWGGGGNRRTQAINNGPKRRKTKKLSTYSKKKEPFMLIHHFIQLNVVATNERTNTWLYLISRVVWALSANVSVIFHFSICGNSVFNYICCCGLDKLSFMSVGVRS